MIKMTSASIIIPTYNEKSNLTSFIEKINKILESKNNELMLEFIFVDDGSEIPINKDIKENEYVKIISNDRNYGYGYSIKKAVNSAKYDLIGIIDSDNSYDLNFLIKELKTFDENKIDMIVGKENLIIMKVF